MPGSNTILGCVYECFIIKTKLIVNNLCGLHENGSSLVYSEEVAHASLLVYIATSRNCIPAIQTVLE